MKKVSRLNFLFAAIVSLISILIILGMVCSYLIIGVMPALVMGILAAVFGDIYYFLTVGLPIMGGMWIGAFSILPSAVFPFILMILGILGFTKLGNKKPLVIINLVFGILALLNGSTLPAIFLIEGAIFGLAALDEEKKLKQEAEAQLEAEAVQEDSLEELIDKM